MSYCRLGRSVWPTSRAYRDRVGLVRKFKLTPNTVALWQFDGNLDDESPNGIYMTATNPHYVWLTPVLRALRLGHDIATSGDVSASVNKERTGPLRLLGDVTADILLFRTCFSGYTDPACILNWDTDSKDGPFLLQSTAYHTRFGWGNVNDTSGQTWTDQSVGCSTLIDRGGLMCLKATRNAAEHTAQIYCNGKKIADGSYAGNPSPANGWFAIFGAIDPSACMCSLRISNVHHSAAHARADYLYTLGQYYGEHVG